MFSNFARKLYLFSRDKRRQVGFLHTKYCSKYTFIHINKTGGTSIEKALNAPLIHKTAMEFRNEIGHDRWNKRFSFAIVRNPWDRAVSQYHYRVMINKTSLKNRKLPFNEWIIRTFREKSPEYVDEKIMFMTQTEWVSNQDGEIIVDLIGRFESLQPDWEKICRRLNKPVVPLPHVKKSSRGDYRTLYNDKSIEIIDSYFRCDIENFGYTFDRTPPEEKDISVTVATLV